jgi:hypothetical protein
MENDDDDDDDEDEVIVVDNVNLKKHSRNQNLYTGNYHDNNFDSASGVLDNNDDNQVSRCDCNYDDYEDMDDDDDENNDDDDEEENQRKLSQYLRLKEQKLRYLLSQQHQIMESASTNIVKRQPHQRLQYGKTNWDDDDEDEVEDDDEDLTDEVPKSTELLKHLKNLKLYNTAASNSDQNNGEESNNNNNTDDSVDVSSSMSEFCQNQQQQQQQEV